MTRVRSTMTVRSRWPAPQPRPPPPPAPPARPPLPSAPSLCSLFPPNPREAAEPDRGREAALRHLPQSPTSTPKPHIPHRWELSFSEQNIIYFTELLRYLLWTRPRRNKYKNDGVLVRLVSAFALVVFKIWGNCFRHFANYQSESSIDKVFWILWLTDQSRWKRKSKIFITSLL